MLTISKPLSATQAQNYHKKEFVSKEQSYWTRGQQIEGEWQGRMAAGFGLVAGVADEHFSRLSLGQHPQTGDQLVRHRMRVDRENGKQSTREHRAGWDATFSAPKSISLTALVGGDHRVREAHRESVRIALEELERYTQARIGGNHRAEATGRFVVAKFEHDTARPVDGYAAPQLHTHCVLFNMTQTEDGRVRAIQPHSLFSSQQYATAIYQAELTYRLVKLGYEIERGRSGAPEIKGYSQEYLDASSPRSQQIRAHMERLGVTSREAAEIAAHATRDRKPILSPTEVLAAHRSLASEFGNQPLHIVEAARVRSRSQENNVEAVLGKFVGEAVTFARARNFEREAVVDRRLLLRDALRRVMGRATFAEVRRNFEERVQKSEFVQIPSRDFSVDSRYTIPSMIAAERQVIRCVLEGQDRFEPIAQGMHLGKGDTGLTASQRATVEHALTSRDRIQGIQGTAGTGKTTALRVIRTIAERERYRVEGFAPTSRAAQELRLAGIAATTLQAFLLRDSADHRQSPGRSLYFLDESSLASTEQVRRFLARLGPQDRVILIGDVRQHQAVEAGKPFEQLQKGGMRTATLDEIVRQKEPALKNAVEHLAKGSISQGLAVMRAHDRIREVSDSNERYRSIAQAFAHSPTQTIIVSADNASRRQLNDAVRTELRASGLIAQQESTFRVLEQQSDLTGADRQWAARYAPGDWLRYARGSRSWGIKGGEYRQIVRVDAANNRLTVAGLEGEEVTYDPRRLSGVSIYRAAERRFAAGDRLQFTAPDKVLGVTNRELGTVESITGSELQVRLDNRRLIHFDGEQHRHFDHGYAMTGHSAQGLTSDRVLINVDSHSHPDLLNSRFAYVAVSRARYDAQIFTDDAQGLSGRLSKEIAKTSALEISTLGAGSRQQGQVLDRAAIFTE